MKKILTRWLPDREKLESNAFMRRYAHWFVDARLWHLNRRSVALSVAVGAFSGLIPGPLQMIGAALLALLFRCNLPLAMLVTLYTNPFTIGPLYWVAYQLGRVVTQLEGPVTMPEIPTWGDYNLSVWLQLLLEWLLSLGWPLVVGLPLLMLILAVCGYVLANWAWRLHVYWHIWLRARRKRSVSGE